MTRILLTTATLVLAIIPVNASIICPAPYDGNSGGQGVSSTYIANTVVIGGVVQNNTGCNVLITFLAGGTITTTNPNTALSYDAGGDDNLIGIINNTGSPITSLNLSTTTSGNDIFGFDQDGICGTANIGAQTTTSPGYLFVGGGNPCTNSTDPSGYGGPYTFALSTSSNNMSGVVNFGNGGIAANGGTSWFSLEGPVDVNLNVTTPEPGFFLLLGIGLAAVILRDVRRRNAASARRHTSQSY